VTQNGTSRNLDIENHFITANYKPCWLEGLTVQGTYFGEFDQGGGVTTGNASTGSGYGTWLPSDYATVSYKNRGATYAPGTILGGVYKQEKWAVYSEAQFILNPNYYKDSYEFSWSNGADYALTEKLKIAGALEWRQVYGSSSFGANAYNGNALLLGTGGGQLNAYTLRTSLGAKYDFGNGLYVQAQYLHYINQAWGVGDNRTKDSDVLTLQTGFLF
jgi:hypothetical protein